MWQSQGILTEIQTYNGERREAPCMEEAYTSETYGEKIAGAYDELYPDYDERAIACLAGLAGSGPALELGIGSGRVALPLQAAGVMVHGVEVSPAMVARLRARPGGERIAVTLGSFADQPQCGQFPLIYVVFNTFFQLLTQQEQLDCFANAARRLAPGGAFVVEAFIPDLLRYDSSKETRSAVMRGGNLEIDLATVDLLRQQITSRHVVLTQAGAQTYPVRMRFAFPDELDLMARLAGLRLRERWGDWDGSPCDGASGKHVSIYEANP